MRLALITSQEPPTWQSCITIQQGLVEAYRHFKAQAKKTFELSPIAVARYRPDTIVFLDHVTGSYAGFVSELAKIYRTKLKKQPKPTLVFHVYGNFTVEPNAWLHMERSLRGFPVRLVCASRRQTNLVRTFFPETGARHIETCPFPVHARTMTFDARLRRAERNKRGWAPRDFVLTYAGRISCQKNVLPLLEHLLHRHGRLKIALAGSFDSVQAGLFRDGLTLDGQYQYEFLELVHRLPARSRERISYLGTLSRPELRALYCASDAYASWSTYHDEDFGMAPAEALATGLPSILADWGGYADFGATVSYCRLVPTRIGARGLELDVNAFDRHVRALVNERGSLDRAQNAALFARHYAPQKLARRLERLLAQPAPLFKSYAAKLHFHAEQLGIDFGSGLYSSPSTRDRYYFANYSYYTGQSS